MKHRILLSVAVGLYSIMPVQAQHAASYLTLERTDGTQTSFEAAGLTIRVQDGFVVRPATGLPVSYAPSELKRMFFSSAPTAIREVEGKESAVEVWTAEGRLQGIYPTIEAAKAALKPGLWFFKSRGVTTKYFLP